MKSDRWSIACRVVDNFGDVGIAWRLARQLAHDDRRTVLLRVDGLDAFASIEPRVDPGAPSQRLDGVEIESWSATVVQAPDVVVELFGGGLPDAIDRGLTPDTIWLDFEYLSAEAWVDDVHGRASPRPDRPLVKHFFCPGFGPRTGGLLRERDLEQRRRSFVGDPQAIATAWAAVGLPPPAAGERRLSLFAYPGVPSPSLFDVLAAGGDGRWTLVVPMPSATRAARRTTGAMTLVTVPFVDADRYDLLLWASDVNFVRGEDSFVRAQWGARPMVWQPYRQADDVHLDKLDAFERRSLDGLSPEAREAQRAVSHGWSGAAPIAASTWRDWLACLPELAAHAARWRTTLEAEPPLVERLIAFVEEKRNARSALVD